jgi:hypothetical protein
MKLVELRVPNLDKYQYSVGRWMLSYGSTHNLVLSCIELVMMMMTYYDTLYMIHILVKYSLNIILSFLALIKSLITSSTSQSEDKENEKYCTYSIHVVVMMMMQVMLIDNVVDDDIDKYDDDDDDDEDDDIDKSDDDDYDDDDDAGGDDDVVIITRRVYMAY